MRQLAVLFTVLFLTIQAFHPAELRAQSSTPPNTVRGSDGKYLPAPGYRWLNDAPGDFRVRWVPGLRHSTAPNVVAGTQEGTFLPAAGYRWLNDARGDLRVVSNQSTSSVRSSSYTPASNQPSRDEIAQAALKALGAVVLHESTKLRRGEEDTLGKQLARAFAQGARDKLIDSALEDVIKRATNAERASLRNLVVLAFDGQLSTDRDTVMAQLRRQNAEMADAVTVAEFLIAIARARSR